MGRWLAGAVEEKADTLFIANAPSMVGPMVVIVLGLYHLVGAWKAMAHSRAKGDRGAHVANILLGAACVIWGTLAFVLWFDKHDHFLTEVPRRALAAITYYAGGCAVGVFLTLAMTKKLQFGRTQRPPVSSGYNLTKKNGDA